MGEWVWVTNLPTVFWPSTVPGQGMILGHSTTDHLEYLSWHVLPASDRKTNENSLNKKCIVSPNKVSGISGCRVGKFSSSMEVDLASQLSPGFSPHVHKMAATAPDSTAGSKARSSCIG